MKNSASWTINSKTTWLHFYKNILIFMTYSHVFDSQHIPMSLSHFSATLKLKRMKHGFIWKRYHMNLWNHIALVITYGHNSCTRYFDMTVLLAWHVMEPAPETCSYLSRESVILCNISSIPEVSKSFLMHHVPPGLYARMMLGNKLLLPIVDSCWI